MTHESCKVNPPGGNREAVERYLRNGSRLEATRQQLFLHTNTVRYRLARFESITGCSLRDYDALAQVWWALAWDRLHGPRGGASVAS